MKRRHGRKNLPQDLYPADIEGLTHDGRGIAHVDGKPVFIDAALEGEAVLFKYTDKRRDYAEGQLAQVISASPQRVEPGCRHYAICGGCSLQHMQPAKQIEFKNRLLHEQLRRIGHLEEVPGWQPIQGSSWGYRSKARLGVKYVNAKQRVLVGFREKRNHFIADLESCPVLDAKVGSKLSALAELVASLSLKQRLPQIEVALGDQGSALVFRILQDLNADDRAKLEAFAARHGFNIYVQRHGPASIQPIATHHAPTLSYVLPEQRLRYFFKPTDFTQVNFEINRKLIQRVLELLEPTANDRVLDLFCGLGNMSLALARHAGRVVGIEGDADLIAQARYNASYNELNNVEFYPADLSQDLSLHEWAQNRYDKLLLDPSRAGAEEVMDYLPRWEAKRIVYVSCNPATLARDADILVHRHGYRLCGAGVLDMFPHTAHVESIALFER